jgi:DNA-directed RNA polymerase specialized sigma24 family protein
MINHEAARLHEFLKALNRIEWYTLVFFYLEHLTTSEIGLVLNLPENRIRLVLQKLRNKAASLLARPADFAPQRPE